MEKSGGTTLSASSIELRCCGRSSSPSSSMASAALSSPLSSAAPPHRTPFQTSPMVGLCQLSQGFRNPVRTYHLPSSLPPRYLRHASPACHRLARQSQRRTIAANRRASLAPGSGTDRSSVKGPRTGRQRRRRGVLAAGCDAADVCAAVRWGRCPSLLLLCPLKERRKGGRIDDPDGFERGGCLFPLLALSLSLGVARAHMRLSVEKIAEGQVEQKDSSETFPCLLAIKPNMTRNALLSEVRQLIPPLSSELHKGQAGRVGIVGGSGRLHWRALLCRHVVDAPGRRHVAQHLRALGGRRHQDLQPRSDRASHPGY
ncbi:hypothetical protein L7F22_040100 [Adiantum nelumboides]|nr:hypothetical protein [Adiantum nelumboides]